MFSQFTDFVETPLFFKAIKFLTGLFVIWIIIRLAQKFLFVKIKDNTNRYRAKKISGFTGYFFTILLLIGIFSDRLAGMSVAIGVAGAGIAFALQEVITSFAGWMAIMFGNFYKTGDRVQLGGIKGDVMDVGVLRTTIMETGQWVDGDLYNGRIVLVANSFVFKEPVYNYSGEFPFLWDEIKVPIQFGSNYSKVTEMLNRIGQELAGELTDSSKHQWKQLQNKYRLEEASTQPMVSMVVNDNWVEFTLRYVVDYKRRRVTKTNLFARVLQDVEKPDSGMRLASATFQLVDPPDLNVKIHS